MKKVIITACTIVALCLCSCRQGKTDLAQNVDSQTEIEDTQKTTQPETIDSTRVSKRTITEKMAYEGVSNYCHSKYDWSVAQDNPSIMYIEMGEETESEYKVVFRSYTGAFVYFYVDKKSGSTRMVEYAPSVDVENEAGTINLFDYLEKTN